MLVLSRKCGEQIIVPSCEMTVTVLGIHGNNVRLGISAPTEVDVYREEIWHRVAAPAQPRKVKANSSPCEEV